MMRMSVACTLVAAVTLTVPLVAQNDHQLTPTGTSELREAVERFEADRAALGRRYGIEYSAVRRERMRAFYRDWTDQLQALDFGALGHEAQVDYVLLDNELRYQLSLLDREERLFADMTPWVPFAPTIMGLDEQRRRFDPPDAPALAATLTALAAYVDSARTASLARWKAAAESRDADAVRRARVVGRRAGGLAADLQRTLRDWHGFYAGYDPTFTWWTTQPFKEADAALARYVTWLRETVIGIRPGEAEPIVGDPIGAAGLQADLAHEMIPYTVEELIAIAEREFAWVEREYRRAAQDMGLGDDWRAALERVKQTYVPPGEQTTVVRDLAREAVEFITSRDLVTVPPLADEIWRMEMMSPERQRVSPFFLGGEIIRVSYPTDEMTHEEKLMSMRGNNPNFSFATVHHELIPGHHLQGFMTSRYNSHRRTFSTPFWGEGWALYWEMLLWDLGFPQTPEERVGMLFWRSHRAARIIFSLSFHLGTMTPQEAVDFLVERVGHERANAEGEVRRSLAGDYSPLYQAAYMLGGLQFRAMHRELVGSGTMTDREFHDAVLRGGRTPVEMVRVRLTDQPLQRGYQASWRFYGDPLRR